MKITFNGLTVEVSDIKKQNKILSLLINAEKVEKPVNSSAGNKYNFWTPESDEELKTLRSQGYTFKSIARKIGRTTHATQNRYYKITH